jgi:hypothetical protein
VSTERSDKAERSAIISPDRAAVNDASTETLVLQEKKEAENNRVLL